MKKNIGLIAGVIAAVIAFTGLYFLYGRLMKRYQPDKLTKYNSQSSQPDNQTSDREESSSRKNKAPDFSVYDKSGNIIRLSDFYGKPVVINFWATWCGYCTMEMPDFNRAYKEYPDVQFMMINATDGKRETVEIANEYVKEQGFEFSVFYDKDYNAISTYGVKGFPASFFIDKNGNLIAGAEGMIGYDDLITGIKMIR